MKFEELTALLAGVAAILLVTGFALQLALAENGKSCAAGSEKAVQLVRLR